MFIFRCQWVNVCCIKKKLVFESCISLCHLRLYKINVSFYFHENILIVAAVVVLGGPMSSIRCYEPLTRDKINILLWVSSRKFKITAGNAGLIKCWQLCTGFNPSASTFNKVGYRVDGTVFVYSKATVCTYAMKMLNAYELIPNPPPLLAIILLLRLSFSGIFCLRRTPVGI